MYDMHLIIDRNLQKKYKFLAESVRQKVYRDDSTSFEEVIYSRNEVISQDRRGTKRKFEDDAKSAEEMINPEKCQGHSTLDESPKCSKSCQLVFEKMYQEKDCNRSAPTDKIMCDHHELWYRFIIARHLHLSRVLYLLKKAMQYQLHKLSKAFGWCVLRRIIKQTNISQFFGRVKDIWPGFFCRCNKKGSSAICSTELVIVVDADEYLEDLPREYFGIPVKQSAFYPTIAKTNKNSDSFTEEITFEKMPTISGEKAQELFLKHTKLTLVYILLVQPCCVQLCCQAKGIIPIGEEHLPIDVCSKNTTVRQGNVTFVHKMYVGCPVGPKNKTSWGTLGGFVQHRGQDAFITCSHVVYDRKVLLSGSKRNKHKEEVHVSCYLNGMADGFVCGHVVDDLFEYDQKEKTSIDAALVVLDRKTSSVDQKEIVQIIGKDENHSRKPVEFLGMTSPYLNDNYKSHKIEKGEMKARLVGAKSGYFERIIKYEDYDEDKQKFVDGLEHGVTPYWEDLAQQIKKVIESNPKPLHVATDVHFQTTIVPKLDEMIKHDRQCVRFYNQLLMENFPFENGDSGTCIYIVDDKTFMRADNQPNPTGCIGMAIASYIDIRDKNMKTIVTPMKAILEAFRLI
ncbi:uncharacterized protein LOC127705672 isoform X3 [Mytilus californianus]|uniref:uncharacterized protein LOC127705672 isoform X2 n=1 Tax=Mytilus californianus TaxID=6549 RepID=UPI00224611FD|nr:uncharacterized protein LOC127705672 isoform X2 [Mytilus californianus]XP_052065973.1 uncharacterized protein LOC127705672 isoform X3 [Mytilus californianus]